MDRPLPPELGPDTTLDEQPPRPWPPVSSRRYRSLVIVLVLACAALAVSNTVLAIRLFAPRTTPSATLVATSAGPESAAPETARESAPGTRATAAEAEPPAAAGATESLVPPALPPIPDGAFAPAPSSAQPGAAAAKRPDPDGGSLPRSGERAPQGSSAERTAAWMVASDGKEAAASRVRAVAEFYEDDPDRQAYWRAVLDAMERVASR